MKISRMLAVGAMASVSVACGLVERPKQEPAGRGTWEVGESSGDEAPTQTTPDTTPVQSPDQETGVTQPSGEAETCAADGEPQWFADENGTISDFPFLGFTPNEAMVDFGMAYGSVALMLRIGDGVRFASPEKGSLLAATPDFGVRVNASEYREITVRPEHDEPLVGRDCVCGGSF